MCAHTDSYDSTWLWGHTTKAPRCCVNKRGEQAQRWREGASERVRGEITRPFSKNGTGVHCQFCFSESTYQSYWELTCSSLQKSFSPSMFSLIQPITTKSLLTPERQTLRGSGVLFDLRKDKMELVQSNVSYQFLFVRSEMFVELVSIKVKAKLGWGEMRETLLKNLLAEMMQTSGGPAN